jgi:hypothetical protein
MPWRNGSGASTAIVLGAVLAAALAIATITIVTLAWGP